MLSSNAIRPLDFAPEMFMEFLALLFYLAVGFLSFTLCVLIVLVLDYGAKQFIWCSEVSFSFRYPKGT